jgi:hypothetical protein
MIVIKDSKETTYLDKVLCDRRVAYAFITEQKRRIAFIFRQLEQEQDRCALLQRRVNNQRKELARFYHEAQEPQPTARAEHAQDRERDTAGPGSDAQSDAQSTEGEGDAAV